MSEQLTDVARRLAVALKDWAYTRKEEDKKRVAELKYELVRVFDEEQAK